MILRSQWIRLGTLTLILACPALAGSSRSSNDGSSIFMDTLHGKARGGAQTGSLIPAFEVNAGQAQPQVRFLSRGPGALLFLTAD